MQLDPGFALTIQHRQTILERHTLDSGRLPYVSLYQINVFKRELDPTPTPPHSIPTSHSFHSITPSLDLAPSLNLTPSLHLTHYPNVSRAFPGAQSND